MAAPTAAAEERGAERVHLQLEVEGALDAGAGAAVLVHNLSSSGALIETDFDLSLGQNIMIALPEVGDVTATVVWRSEQFFGCQFVQPLPRAALSAASLRNPPPPQSDPSGREENGRAPLSLGAKLRRLREDRGLSLAGLAKSSGLSKPSIWAWESGRTAPRRKNLQILADALGASEEEFSAYLDPRAGCLFSAQDPNDAANGLKDEIAASKRRIADVAGVDADHVRIIVEF